MHLQQPNSRPLSNASNIGALGKTCNDNVTALETTNAAVANLGTKVACLDANVQSMSQQMAGALEVAVAKGMEAQEKKMESKFEQLMGMLASSRSGKRASAPAETIKIDDEDHDMESPIKPPVNKK